MEKLDVFHRKGLRKIMKIRWFEMVSEEELRRRTGQPTIIEKLRVNRWRWYGHVLRMPEGRIPKQAMGWKPKDTWQRTIQRDMTEKGLDRADVEARAGDRDAWRKFVADLWAT